VAEELRPLPAQERFLRCNAREALFGGAAGPGKSFALLLDAASRVDHPHYRALLLRRTFTELESTLIDKSKNIYPHLGGRYNEAKHIWTFPQGGKVQFGYLQHEADLERYKGPEYQFIGWDELTTFPKPKPPRPNPYEFLFSRLRSPHGLACYMRAASNPGGPGADWVFERFSPWLWQPGIAPYPGPRTETGKIPRPAPGQALFFRRNREGVEVVCRPDWHDPTCTACAPGAPCIKHRPRERVYFPALIGDNPFLAGTEYEAELYNLPPLERARLLHGDWNIQPAAGMFFKQDWFKPVYDAAPAAVLARTRYWDRAATEGNGDWTVGVKMSLLPGPTFVVEDVKRAQLGPGGVEQLILKTAEDDGLETIVALEQDPASAGKFEAFTYARLLAGKAFRAVPPQGSKLVRARPASAQAFAGNIGYVRGPWNRPYFAVLEGWDGTDDTADDDVDATSGAFRVLVSEWERVRPDRRRGRVSTT
jgi:predicted phage terminase large subunit-like protein